MQVVCVVAGYIHWILEEAAMSSFLFPPTFSHELECNTLVDHCAVCNESVVFSCTRSNDLGPRNRPLLRHSVRRKCMELFAKAEPLLPLIDGEIRSHVDLSILVTSARRKEEAVCT